MTLPVAFIRVKMSSGGCGTLRIETYVHVLPCGSTIAQKGAGNTGMIVAIFRPFDVCSVMPSVARAGGIKRTR